MLYTAWLSQPVGVTTGNTDRGPVKVEVRDRRSATVVASYSLLQREKRLKSRSVSARLLNNFRGSFGWRVVRRDEPVSE